MFEFPEAVDENTGECDTTFQHQAEMGYRCLIYPQSYLEKKLAVISFIGKRPN